MVTSTRLIGGRYALVRLLGAGGFAEVWLATDESMGGEVALKLPRGQRSALAGPAAESRRELAAVQRLDHPHIVRLLDSGEDGGEPYLAMEYVDGPSLRERLSNGGPLSPGELNALARELCAALQHAHDRGVLHNDIKPENVLLGRQGAKLADFGAAAGTTTTLATRSAAGLTATLAYLAPEVLQGEDAGPGSDIYALGLVLFEAAAGRLPWPGNGAAAVTAQRITGPAPALRELAPGVPGPFAAAVDRAIALDPTDRFASADEFAAALEGSAPTTQLSAILGATPERSAPSPSSRRTLVAATAVLASVIAAAGLVSGLNGQLGGAGGSSPTVQPTTPPGSDRILAVPTPSPTAAPTVEPTPKPLIPRIEVKVGERGNSERDKPRGKPKDERSDDDDD